MHGDRASLAVLRLRRKTDRPLPRLIHVIPLKPEGVLIKPDTYKIGNPVACSSCGNENVPPHKRPDRIAPVGPAHALTASFIFSSGSPEKTMVPVVVTPWGALLVCPLLRESRSLASLTFLESYWTIRLESTQ